MCSLQHQCVSSAEDDAVGTYWLLADSPKGTSQLDGLRDGGQVCIRNSLLERVSYPWWPESPNPTDVRHMDGGYLENVARAAIFQPVGEVMRPYVVHRFTPVSTFSPFTG
jgi:hypothetical protein